MMISAAGLCFRYPGQAANSPAVLQNISLQIQSGEYVAIVGGNGSGKSTLVKLIDGLLLPTSGQLTVNGVPVAPEANLAELRKHVGIIFQFPEDQIVATTIEEDVAFGLENYGVPGKEMRARVRKILEGFDLWDIRGRTTTMLSGGQTQRLALAGVLAIEPECLIFDEATSMLDPAARKNLLGVMRGFHKEGKTLLHVTHSMEEALQADRVLVLKDGQLVFDGSPWDLFSLPDIAQWNLEYPDLFTFRQHFRQMGISVPETCRTIHELARVVAAQVRPAKQSHPLTLSSVPNPVITISELAYKYLAGTPGEIPALFQVDMEIPGGLGYGLIGKTGSGKSTVLQHMNGLFKPQQGHMRVGEHDLTQPYRMQDIVRSVGLVMQNPENHFFEYFVGDEIAFGPRNIGYDGRLADRVRWAMELVGLDFETFRDKPVHTLSGGQKRKVALASALAMKPAILALDEPTAGLDPLSRREVLARFAELQRAGMTLVVSSHNLSDIATLTERMTIMEAGRSTASGRTAELLWDENTLLNHGIEPLAVTRLGHELERTLDTGFQPIVQLNDLLRQVEVKDHE
jgi:energy-coupling factor transport system ATP-binding protein